jgi:hypothetical protein
MEVDVYGFCREGQTRMRVKQEDSVRQRDDEFRDHRLSPACCESCIDVVHLNLLDELPRCDSEEVVPYNDPALAGEPGKNKLSRGTWTNRSGGPSLPTGLTNARGKMAELLFCSAGLNWD